MKNIIILLLFFSVFQSKAQTYTPFNIDTSCFWLHDMYTYVYDNFNMITVHCQAETMTFVEKDTLINTEQFFVLKTFTIGISQNQGYQCDQLFPNGITSLIKEDTINHSILQLRFNGIGPDTSIIEFDHNVGDTLFMFHNVLSFIIVDSISFENYNGVTRKALYVHSSLPTYSFKIIEGIGSIYNFPSIAFMEFGYPASTLKCYSKQGKILYGDTSSPCQKKPQLPVSIPQQDKVSNFEIQPSENSIAIKNKNLLKLEVTICNIYGQTIFHDIFQESLKEIDIRSFVSGLFIISVSSEKLRQTNLFIANQN